MSSIINTTAVDRIDLDGVQSLLKVPPLGVVGHAVMRKGEAGETATRHELLLVDHLTNHEPLTTRTELFFDGPQPRFH